MPVKIHHFPALALFASGALIGVLLVSMAFLPKIQTLAVNAQNDYGNSLASMTARQAIDASFNHDLVRLQLILQDVVANPHLAQATIHDVENNLLVQAGEVRPTETGFSAYTSSIVLHDSVAGFVTITLKNFDKESGEAGKIILFSILFLCALIAWSIYRERALEWVPPVKSKTNQTGETFTENQEDADGHKTNTAEEENAEDIPSVYAVIYIKNHDVLKQQLNRETFHATLQKLEGVIADVLALYNGREFHREENRYVLSFNAIDATNEAIFRASCSAFLIVELASILDKVPLDLASFVSANRDDLVPAKLPVAGLILESQAAQDELIQRRLLFMEVGTEDGRTIVADFEQPFKSLLENQRTQLSNLQKTKN